MAIDKVTPQKLNSSVDARYRSNTDMSDALNINFGEDHKSNSGDSTSGGDLGVLKPTPSNTVLEGSNLSSNSRVIGSVTDDVLGVIFFFIWAANADEMGVWAYDRDGVLPGSSADSYVKVLTSSRFGFPALGFVDGDVVHIGQKYSLDSRDIQDPTYSDSSDKSCVLYFTDNINEPRKLDVYRAMTSDLSGYGVYDINDLIKACPRTPLEPITFEFSISPLRKTSNFEKIPGMQFAYQFMYRGGVESPISTYSRLAVPKEYIQQGINTSPTLNENVCILKLPPASPTASIVKNITEEVEKIRILVRFGNAGGWKVIEEIKTEKFVQNNYTYLFYNDKILIPVSEEETAMHFSGLPRKARSQAIVSNRLIYANYLEGFDNVECTAIATPVYKEVSQNIADLNIVVRPYILQPLKTDTGGTLEFDLDGREQKIAGYKFDTGGVPWSELPIGSVIDISFTANPEKNYHIYDYANSFHGTDQVGGVDSETSSVEYTIQDSEMEDNLRSGRQVFGANNGVGFHLNPAVSTLESGSILHNEWVSINPYTGAETVSPVVHGTSAATPLIIKGGSVDFKLRFTTNYNVFNNASDEVSDVRLAVRDAIYFFLTGEGQMPTQCAMVDGVEVCIPFATLINNTNKNTSSYSFDFGVDSGSYREPSDSAAPFRNKFSDSLVCGLSDKIVDENNEIDYDLLLNSPPVGYFAVIKADVTIGLTSMKATMNERYAEGTEYGDPEDAYIALEVVSLENVATRTCIPVIEGDSGGGSIYSFGFQDELQNLIFSHWTVRTDDEIQQITASDFATNDGGGPELDSQYNLGFTNLAHIRHDDIESTAYPTQLGNASRPIIAYGGSNVNGESFSSANPDPLMNTENERLKLVGYLRANTSLSGEQPKLLLTGDEYRDYRKSIYEEFTNTLLSDSSILERFKFSLLDGEGVNSFTGACIFLGWMLYKPGPDYKKVSAPNGHQTMLLSFNNNNNDYLNVTSSQFPDYLTDTNTILHSWIEILISSSYISIGGNLSSYGSYKSSCNHDFGIIYYDERGRSGLVNYLTSVYVGGFSDMEPLRGGDKGRALIAIDIQHEPPSWAHSYQIAYGGNSSMEDFVQYSTGPAFVDISNGNGDLDGIIYVSLAYLQGDNNVSYSDSWGSVNKDGGNSLYTYSIGDKLRVISYFENDALVAYPNNYEFEVIGVKTMTSSTTENFFHGPNDGGEVHPSKIGEFIMLKNNAYSLDFSYADVYNSFIQDNGFSGTTIHNKWNNKTIVEIYSPKKNLDVESRIYYETGNKHNVSTNPATGQRYHQSNPLLLEDGDVYFRKVPVNFPFNSSNGYVPLLNSSSSNSNFRNYFLETDTFTDLFAGANGKNYGKPKIMFSTATEARNRSSVTFSERNNYSSRFNSFTRFNPTILPFKDLPNEYGAIQSLVNEYDSILVIQENKISAIPVERNILSTAGGSTSLIASGKVLGTQRFYAGDYGCDTNPESVTRAGTSVYFASKKRKEVYMYSPNQGVAVVSDAGMKTFFYSLFSNAMANADTLGVVRVVGGYDPLKDEFLLSVINDADPNLASGGGGMITIEGGDLGDVIPINLSVSGEYGGAIEDVVYDDGGDTSAIEISALEAELAVANSTVEDLIALVNEISSDLLEATSDLGELQIFFNDLLGDAANGALYSTGLQTATLPNGEIVNYSTYSQFVNAVSNEIVAAEALIDELNDKIVDTNLEIGLLYNSFISNTNNFVSLTESYQTVLLELDLVVESTQIDLFLGEIENNIPVTETIQMTYSNGNVVTITVTDELNNSWMASINALTSSINTLFQGIPQGPTGFAELVTTAIQNLDTTNANLISAFRNFIESITSVRKQNQTLLFGDDEIGDRLAAFLAGTGLDGLDGDGDGVFTNTELNALPSVSSTTTKFQNALDNYINGLTVVNTNLSNFINDLLAVADEETYNYVDQNNNPITLNADNAQLPGVGFASYIDFLEGKLSIAQGDASDAISAQGEAEQALSNLRDDVVDAWNAAVADGSLTYNEIAGGGTSITQFNENIITNLTTSSEASYTELTTLNGQIDNIESHLTALHGFLLTAGYASENTEGFNAYGLPDVKLNFLKNSVEDGLINLRLFQELFAESENQYGKTGRYRVLNNGQEQLIDYREVTAKSIVNNNPSEVNPQLVEEALTGVKRAIDTIQSALVATGIEAVNGPTNYLSADIRSLLQGSGETITTTAENLTQYIRANGITMEEYSDFSKNSQSNEGLDEQIWTSINLDTNSDNSIGTSDLLQLLSVYGAQVVNTNTRYTYKTNEVGELETDEDGNFILVQFTP